MAEKGCIHSDDVMLLLGEIHEKCNDNGRHIGIIEEKLGPLEIETKVAKRLGGAEGRKWGAIVGAAVAAAFAAAGRFFGP